MKWDSVCKNVASDKSRCDKMVKSVMILQMLTSEVEEQKICSEISRKAEILEIRRKKCKGRY